MFILYFIYSSKLELVTVKRVLLRSTKIHVGCSNLPQDHFCRTNLLFRNMESELTTIYSVKENEGMQLIEILSVNHLVYRILLPTILDSSSLPPDPLNTILEKISAYLTSFISLYIIFYCNSPHRAS